MSGLGRAVVFLTRVPLRYSREAGLAGASPWFPVVGAMIGLVVACVYTGSLQLLPALLAAVIAVAAGVWLTGAIHEDGLADTFDALGSGATAEDAIAIMRDARLGTFGTIAVAVSLLWRVSAIAVFDSGQAIAALVAAHSLGRTVPVVLMAHTAPARRDGLGREGVSAVTFGGMWFAVASGVAISSIFAGWWVAPILVVVAVVSALVRAWAIRRIGGITGDILGGSEQLTELVALAALAGAAGHGWVPWWVG